METKHINGAEVTMNTANGTAVTIVEKIGYEFVFLALLNKTDNLGKLDLGSISSKLSELIQHEDGERKKHLRKIVMDTHLRIITNGFLKYLNEESKLQDKQIHSILTESIFCIIQPSIKYGQGIIIKNGVIQNNEELFTAMIAEKPSFIDYLDNPINRQWYKPNENLFFLNELEVLTLMGSSPKNEYQGFIRIVLKAE